MEKQTLSNKIVELFEIEYLDSLADVQGDVTILIKQAVQELKSKMFGLFGHQTGGTMGEIDKIVDEIFGDKLI